MSIEVSLRGQQGYVIARGQKGRSQSHRKNFLIFLSTRDFPGKKINMPGNNADTPMFQQYREIKSRYSDAILFYRMGDFYEMFFQDAIIAAPILEVALTSRDKSSENQTPMCGVPLHSATTYIQKLLSQGYKVAICEQLEDATAAKGLVRRDVVRVMTPSLIGDPELVPLGSSNFLVVIDNIKATPPLTSPDENNSALTKTPPNENNPALTNSEDKKSQISNETSYVFDVCFVDLLCSEVYWESVPTMQQVIELCAIRSPKEMLIRDEQTLSLLTKHLPQCGTQSWAQCVPQCVVSYRDSYFTGQLKSSLTAAERYIEETQKVSHFLGFSKPHPLVQSAVMQLDPTALTSLEILKSQDSVANEGMSLFKTLDRTTTAMGHRTLKKWLEAPLTDLNGIEKRLGAVKNFFDDHALEASIKQAIRGINDLERLTTKTTLGLANPKDMAAIRNALQRLPSIIMHLAQTLSPWLQEISQELQALDGIDQLCEYLNNSLLDDAPRSIKDGGIFKDTVCSDIGELRQLSRSTKETILNVENREKQRTGIASLKIKYSRVFGYTIEITKSYLDRVPSDYIRKQTIAGGERFITEELKCLEDKIITADIRLKALEESLFRELTQRVAALASELIQYARLIGVIDVLCGFAEVSRTHAYCFPHVHSGWELQIQDGRHPVVENLLPRGTFVPNSVSFSERCRTLVITGPNMGGKSTIMRQVALTIIMAQIGCFVPAASATLPIVDAIFTRIGSHDDLNRGRSTFMVEMTEVAHILSRASSRGLILIDEIGRGTSTYDGLSLAWAILEHLHTEIRGKVLFATHFVELTSLENSLLGLKNAHMMVKRSGEEIIFLYKLSDGVCHRSYGIEVAKLAGLSTSILTSARKVQGALESFARRNEKARTRLQKEDREQLLFFDGPPPEVEPPQIL